jgi:glycosyltransferase involved in cell wall biosynthesis
MDFVTITDHNTVNGCLEIGHLPGTFMSVEITSYLPEIGCKVHVVALDISEAAYADLMHLRKNVYDLVEYLRQRDIVHFIAHPLYDMDDRLSVDTVEKMMVLFDVVEIRNGARAGRFNAFIQELVASLTPESYDRLRNKHDGMPVQSSRWNKAVVAGSDDHSGFFVARAHTSVPKAETLATFLQAIRDGRSHAGGDDGDALTLAHTIYGIAYRFYIDKVKTGRPKTMPFVDLLLNRCFHADRRMTALEKVEFFIRKNMPELLGGGQEQTFEQLMDREARKLLADKNLFAGIPAEDRNRKIFAITSSLANRMIYHYTRRLVQTPLDQGFVPFLQSLGTLGVIHALASPYYLACYHQHRSKPLLRDLRRAFSIPKDAGRERTALFTDTLHEINGVAMTIKRLVRTAKARGVDLTVITTGTADIPETDGVRTFRSVGDVSLPEYPELTLRFPPILDVLDYIERQGFTRIHVSTPGTMGLLGLALAKLMDIPVAATYHTDIPQYVGRLTNDVFLENTAWNFILWFYNQMDEVLVPSTSTRDQLVSRGLAQEKVKPLPRWVDASAFSPQKRDPLYWRRFGLDVDVTFLYAGRVSKEKNLALLADVFRDLVQTGRRAGLVVVGDGPFRQELEQRLHGLPVLFTGFLHGDDLARAYASSDIFVFPSTTDTFGNVVLEAQASGIPVIVSDAGGPKELMVPDETGLVVKANDRSELQRAMTAFLYDRHLGWSMGEQARRFIESRAPLPEEVYSTILKT